MGVLLERSVELQYYEKIPYLCTAVITFRNSDAERKLRNVGKIFAKYGAWKHFALSMLHRHFDMNLEKEVLVETPQRDGLGSVALPWQNVDGKPHCGVQNL